MSDIKLVEERKHEAVREDLPEYYKHDMLREYFKRWAKEKGIIENPSQFSNHESEFENKVNEFIIEDPEYAGIIDLSQMYTKFLGNNLNLVEDQISDDGNIDLSADKWFDNISKKAGKTISLELCMAVLEDICREEYREATSPDPIKKPLKKREDGNIEIVIPERHVEEIALHEVNKVSIFVDKMDLIVTKYENNRAFTFPIDEEAIDDLTIPLREGLEKALRIEGSEKIKWKIDEDSKKEKHKIRGEIIED